MDRVENGSVAEIAAWYFGVVDRWPDVFDRADLGQLWNWASRCVDLEAEKLDLSKTEVFVGLLRAALLKRVHSAVSSCDRCVLHKHRLKGRPVLDDGDIGNDPFVTFGEVATPIGAVYSRIMIVAEG
jgi:hypothetical protein